jgi:integration host factor subunit alpha
MRDSLTRDKLSDILSDKTGIRAITVRKYIDVTLARMADGIVRDGKLKLSGFGTFEVLSKKERLGRNPKTGEDVMITPRRTVSLSVSQGLKSKINFNNEKVKK